MNTHTASNPSQTETVDTDHAQAAAPQEAVIRFEDVSVRYRVPRERISGLKEYAIRWMQRRVQFEDFWALKDVSFEVMPGEIVGVTGLLGSGAMGPARAPCSKSWRACCSPPPGAS